MHYYVYNRPEDKLHHETPARFTWFPVEGAQGYAVVVYDAQGAEAFRYEGIDINFFTPPDVMAPGAYRYSVYADGQEIISRQPFAIAEDAVQTPLPPREGRYAAIGGHPRIWLGEEGIARLAEQHTGELRAEWGRFLQTGVVPWVDTPVHKEPDFYPGNKRVIPLWRAMYTQCQEALYAVKHCAVAWRVTGDGQYLQAAKRWLMALASWDVNGATARAYNDESGFRVTTALAWGYDWLYDDLTAAERQQVRAVLLARGRELYDYVRNQISIHIKLLDSHGVRSLSMTLVPAALALYGEEPEAARWLDYTIEYFFTLFTPWGGEDGGWAEGPAYWQSGVSFFTEAICLIRQATGIDVFRRPFFQHTGDFPLNAYCQDLRFMAFCDMSDLGDYPGMKAGYTLRILSAVSDAKNRGQYAWYYDQAKVRGVGTEDKFYNYGWWNFDFDELFFRMLFAPVPPETPPAGVSVRRFDDIGWVCVHKDMADAQNHVALMFKASPYGAVSHSHGDQNAFVLHAYGEPLAIQSGYYIGFWSEMHVNWRRKTKSKNAILIDGVGQYSDIRKQSAAEELNGSAKSQYDKLIAANGRIEACVQEGDAVYIRGDATQAFAQTVPQLIAYKRHMVQLWGEVTVVVDEVELTEDKHIDWLLHGLAPFDLDDNRMRLTKGDVGLEVRLLGSDMALSQTDTFDDVAEAEVEGLPPQWHAKATTKEAAKSHRIVAVLYPFPKDREQPLQVQQDNGITVRVGERVANILPAGEGLTVQFS